MKLFYLLMILTLLFAGSVNSAPIFDLDDPIMKLLANSGVDVVWDGTYVWIGTSNDALYGFHDMTMSWATTLQGTPGVNVTVEEYSAYEGGGSAVGGRYLNHLLEGMLIFHSNSFYPNGLDD